MLRYLEIKSHWITYPSCCLGEVKKKYDKLFDKILENKRKKILKIISSSVNTMTWRITYQ